MIHVEADLPCAVIEAQCVAHGVFCHYEPAAAYAALQLYSALQTADLHGVSFPACDITITARKAEQTGGASC